MNGSGCFVTEATLRTMLGGGKKKVGCIVFIANSRSFLIGAEPGGSLG